MTAQYRAPVASRSRLFLRQGVDSMPKIDWENVKEWDGTGTSDYTSVDFSQAIHESEGIGRNTYCFKYACSLRAKDVPESEAWMQLQEFNQTHCIPPLGEGELRGRLKSAYSYSAGPSGTVRSGSSHASASRKADTAQMAAEGGSAESEEESTAISSTASPAFRSSLPSAFRFRDIDYKLYIDPAAVKLPEVPPMQPAQQLLLMVQSLLRKGELANIVLTVSSKGQPYGGGIMVDSTLTEEQAEDILAHVDKSHGAFIRINPTSGRHEDHGKKAESDADVTAFRHMLIEYDPPQADAMSAEELEAAKLEWLKHVLALKLPIATIVDSAHRSVHLAATIAGPDEAIDLGTWKARRDFVYHMLRANGVPYDTNTYRPSNMGRLAGAERNGHMQRLIATGDMLEGICHTWTEWRHMVYTECEECHERVKGGNGRYCDNPNFHVWISRRLLYGLGACRVEGAPAILDMHGHWQAGWDAVERGILTFWPQAKDGMRKEVMKRLDLTIPDRRPAPPEVVAFSNGFLNMRTMEFSTTCSAPILNNVPCEWNPGATSEAVERMLKAVSDGDEATLKNIEEMLGHILFRNSSTYQYIWVLLGGGSNGKSTLLDTIRDVLGPENISGLLPEDLKGNTARADLIGKLAMIADDPASGAMTEETKAQLKKVSGGNLVDTDVKYKPRVSFTPYCTCVLSYNSFPKIPNPEHGFMRRLVVIPFLHAFSPDDESYDPHIRRHLATEEARQALLVHAVRGFRRLDLREKPTPNPLGEAMKAEVETDSDSVLAWKEAEGITAEADLYGQPAPDVFKRYTDWCEKNGFTECNSTAFGKRIRRHFSVKVKQAKDGFGKSFREYAPASET